MFSASPNRRAFFTGAMMAPWIVTTAGAAELSLSSDSVAALLAGAMAEARAYPCNAMVAGLCDAGGQHVVPQGSAGNGRVLDGDTVFDIGSISKLFTALALADMVARGQMAMQDPLAKYLPAGVQVPQFGGKPITLLDLATYSPGLPGWPADMPALSEKPFPDYSVDRLYRALSHVKLDAAPGSKYVYSNFGYGLLGLALARHAGMDFESLIVSRICKPLGMESTRIVPTPQMRARVTPGHFKSLDKTASWNMPPAFAAAGAFRSTANDLLKFLAAAMGPSPLAPAFAEMMRSQRPADKPDTQVAAGWFLSRGHGDRLIWKDGGVLGYSSFIGYSALRQNGVVVLANGNCGVLNLGKHLLNTQFPLQG